MIDNFTDTELTNEVWRDVDGYDGMYQVSDLGRVRSRKSGEWKIMKAKKRGSGYFGVVFYKNGKQKQSYIHRLVAQAFIENDDDTKIYINHRNEIKSDNKVSNLEYCTAQYNTNYNDVQFRKRNSVRRKIDKLYDTNLSSKENIELFKTNGIECCEKTVQRLRKDLGLTRKYTKRS